MTSTINTTSLPDYTVTILPDELGFIKSYFDLEKILNHIMTLSVEEIGLEYLKTNRGRLLKLNIKYGWSIENIEQINPFSITDSNEKQIDIINGLKRYAFLLLENKVIYIKEVKNV